MNEFKFTDALICVFIGMVLMSVLLMVIPNSAKIAHDALEVCEAELPRDQQCKITAIPE